MKTKLSVTVKRREYKKYAYMMKKAFRATMKYEDTGGYANLYICDDAEIRKLNLKFRNIDKPTDVLSFPSGETDFLGDIAVSYDTAKRQANEFNHSLNREMGFLTVHAALHLLGFDHISEEDEETMRLHAREILKILKLGVK